MIPKILSLIHYLYAHPRRLFLLDFGGALLTAFFTGVVLANFKGFFGTPRHILYDLSLVACVYAAYGLACYFLVSARWSFFLKVLVIFNLLYFCFSFQMVSLIYDNLTLAGLTYFSLEMLVMGALIVLELSVLSKMSYKHSI